MTTSYLPRGLAVPVAETDGLTSPYRDGARRGELLVQRCKACHAWQWGPEYICHRCHGFDMGWERIEPQGIIYSWERVWHPVHPALHGHGPYIVVLVELPAAGNIRMVGNLLGDPRQTVEIGSRVQAVFEHHEDEAGPFSLVQWRMP